MTFAHGAVIDDLNSAIVGCNANWALVFVKYRLGIASATLAVVNWDVCISQAVPLYTQVFPPNEYTFPVAGDEGKFNVVMLFLIDSYYIYVTRYI